MNREPKRDMADPYPPSNTVQPDGGQTQEFDPRARAEDPLLGQVVENYHVTGILGKGAHGTVYRARDIRLDRTVALKVLQTPEDSGARDKLLQEGRTIAGMGAHPNIVQVFAWGEWERYCYFALEFGPTSGAQLLETSPEGLAEAQVLRIMLECADGLAHAHARGMLHLDIKPANILLEEDGSRARLCDFGLAQLFRLNDDAARGICGSPAYMSPEQLRGEPLAPASDIFSLGATCYQLLCGQLPFGDGPLSETTNRILSSDHTPLAQLRPDLTVQTRAIIDRCLATAPEDRYATAEDVVRAVRHAIKGPSRRPVPTRMRTAAIMAAALIVVALGSVVLPLFSPQGNRSSNIVVAEGRAALERGDYEEAVRSYSAMLEQHPQDEQLLYGLGYAALLARNFDDAKAAFSRLQDGNLAAEGLVATAQAQEGALSRPVVDAATGSDASPYASVLRAVAEVAQGDFTGARSRLADIDPTQLVFDWQRARYWQTRGQASFRMGDLAEARDAFEQSGHYYAQGRAANPTAAYLDLTQQQLQQNERAALREQIGRLKTIRESVPEITSDDDWSSRPLRLWIPPVDAGRSILATETGLADVLPWKLSKALVDQETLPIEVVDRNYTAALLQEQSLSSQLSSTADAVRLGRLLGARLALFCRFSTVLGEESLNATLVDVETSRSIPLAEIPLAKTSDLSAWISAVSEEVVAQIGQAYPVRGRIRVDANEATINIGSAHGLKAGDHLRLMAGPGAGFILPSAEGVVLAPVNRDRARVQIDGVNPDDAPEGGWYGEVMTGQRNDA